MSTEYYADYIKKTTFDPESHSTRSKIEEAATDVKKKPASKTPKVEVEPTEVPEENLDEKGKGLWANIHAKRARGEKPNPPGHPDRPSAADLKRSQNKEEVAKEELHGDQHKLDHNKDNKIDKADMKTVRKKGAVKDHPMAEKKSLASLRNTSMLDGKDRLKKMAPSQSVQSEATFKVNVEGLPTMYIDGAGAGEIKTSLRKQLKDPKTITSIEKISPSEKKKELRAKVAEEDRVDELSPSTKMSYVRKAASDIDNRSYAQGVDDVKGQGNDYDGANNKRIGNRLKGIKRATKEENQVDEISGKTLASYAQGASSDMYGRALRKGMDIQRGSSDKDNDRKIKNRGSGIAKANMRMAGKMAKHNEDTETVDELNRDTLASYISKASDASKHRGMPTKKVDNRYSGVAKASKKIDKMEEGIGDAIDKVKSIGSNMISSYKKSRNIAAPGKGRNILKGESMEEDNNYGPSHPLRKHLKKVGKGGEVEYSHNDGKTKKGRYGGLMNRGGRSYAKVHHDTHMAMVPMTNVKYPD